MKYFYYTLLLFSIASCTNKEENPTKSEKGLVTWSDSIQSVIPLEKDTLRDNPDFTNIDAAFDKEKIFNSILSSIRSGKMKAYTDYPKFELSQKDIDALLVKWDSTNVVEDPNNPGVTVSAPMKIQITSAQLSQIRLHESISFDTLSGTFDRKVKFMTVYIYKFDDSGAVLGLKKLFDVAESAKHGEADNKKEHEK
jgi:hypothetical protein